MITESGLTIKSLSDIIDETNDSFRGEFGDNIDLSATSVLGQIIGIMSERESLIWELAEDVYNSQYPTNSIGRSLDLSASITGTVRRPATYSTIADGVARGENGTVVPRGTIVATDEGARFQTLEEATINIPDTVINYKSPPIPMRGVATGPLIAAANTLTDIITPVVNMRAFTNESPAILGSNIENDTALRVRRANELNAAGVATVGAIQSFISSRPLVSSVRIFENRDSITDSLGRPPHSIEAMIQGDTDQALGEALFQAAPAGVTFYGNTSVDIVDSEGVTQTIRFSRPILTNIFASFRITTTGDYPADGDDQIKTAVESFASNYNVGDTIILYGTNALICVVDKIPGIISALITVGRTADTLQGDSIQLGQRALPRIPKANVTIIKN